MNIGGEWQIVQGEGTLITLKNMTESGGNIIGGSAKYFGDSGTIVGGSVYDAQITFDVAWNGGAKGRYTGRKELDDGLHGDTHDLNNATSHVNWYSINGTF